MARYLFFCLLLAGFSFPVSAARIPKLYNTGVDDQHQVVPGGEVEKHYTMRSTDPLALGPNCFVLVDSYPVSTGTWLANSDISKWIGPKKDQDPNNPTDPVGKGSTAGLYVFETSFDLTGFDPATAIIRGRLSTDNNGVGIWLNGNQVFTSDSFIAWTAFTINSGFQPGTNHLRYVVTALLPLIDSTGFRVEYESSVCPPASAKPLLEEEPADQTVPIGREVVFRTRVDCGPTVTYQWKKKRHSDSQPNGACPHPCQRPGE